MLMAFRITDSLKPEIKHKPDFLRGTYLRKIRKQIIGVPPFAFLAGLNKTIHFKAGQAVSF